MSEFNDRIIAEFRANGGRVGPPFEGADLLLLHHTGAKSGIERISPLATFPEDDAWVVVASAGGQPQNPAWFHNLVAHPDTVIEFGAETVPVRASVIAPDEHPLVWQRVVSAMAGFQGYQDAVTRTIPLVRLSRR